MTLGNVENVRIDVEEPEDGEPEWRRVIEGSLSSDLAILMVGLGISDSLRGIFSGIFQTHFALTAKGLSTHHSRKLCGKSVLPAGRRQNHG